MANQENKSIASICRKDKMTRCDYFSDTYSAIMTVNGEKRLMDITHISLPFKPAREKAVVSAFDLNKEELEDLYTNLAACTTNNAHVTTYLNRIGTESILNILRIEANRKKIGRGSDIYMVTEHLRPLVSTYFNEETTVKQILWFGGRLTKMIGDIHQSGKESVTMRVIDPEQIFVDDNGKFVFGSFQHAYNERMAKTNPPIKLSCVAPSFHVHPRIARGESGDIGTDMYSIASILWSLLNGDGFDRPTPTGTPPQFAPDKVVPILELGLNADPEMFSQFKRQLTNIVKELNRSGEGNIKVPVPVAEPIVALPTAVQDFGEESTIIVQKQEEVPAEIEEEKTKVVEEVKQEPIEELDESMVAQETEPVVEQEEPVSSESAEEIDVAEVEDVEQEVSEAEPIEEVPEEPVEETAEEPEIEDVTVAAEEEAVPEDAEKDFEDTVSLDEDAAEPVTETVEDIAPVEEIEEVATDEDDYDGGVIKVLDTSDYIENNDAEAEMSVANYDELMNFNIVYRKPIFFVRQLIVAAAIVLAAAAMAYLSIATHLIPIW